jgi:rubrerythrin
MSAFSGGKPLIRRQCMSFDVSDVLEFAMRIEENGADFYRLAMQITNDEEMKQTFACLADDELTHKKTFGRILATIGENPPAESYPGEYADYLRNYIDNTAVFTKSVMERELAAVTDTLSALDFALRREQDSILFYHEIKNMVPPGQHAALDLIIEEERRHFSKLSELKKRF